MLWLDYTQVIEIEAYIPQDKNVHPSLSLKFDTKSRYSLGAINPPPALYDTLCSMKVVWMCDTAEKKHELLYNTH